MTFVTGTRASQANPAEDLYTQISTALTAHGNYTFVEDYTVTTVKHSVWRNKASGNAAGLQFYIIFTRPIAAGSLTLYVSLSEDYDAVGHQVIRPAPHPYSTNANYTTGAPYYAWNGTGNNVPTSTFPLDTNLNNTTAYRDIYQATMVTSTTSYSYGLHVHNNGINFYSMVGTTTYPVWVECFESLVDTPATNDPLPLYIAQGTVGDGASVHYGGFPRAPLVTAANAQVRMFAASFFQAWPSQAQVGTVGSTGNLFQSNRPSGGRCLVRSAAQHNGIGANLVGYNRGLSRTLLLYGNAAGVTTGDTITVGTDTYTFMNGSSQQLWAMTSAA